MAPVPGGRFIRVFTCRGGARALMIRVFTRQRGPRRAQEADSYVFLRVFLESDRGPRRVQEADSYVFYRGLGACAPHHTCFTVSAVVAASFPAVLTPFDGTVIFLHAGGLLLGSYGKTCRARWSRNDLSIESYAL